MRFIRDHPSAVNSPNLKPRMNMMEKGSPLKATVQYALWNLSLIKKKSSGAEPHAEIISTGHVSINGLLPQALKESAVSTGGCSVYRIRHRLT